MSKIALRYKRVDVFTLSSILDQIVECVKSNGVLPDIILLPPEEYVYISYLMPNWDLRNQVKSFCGIELEVLVGDHQDKVFGF